MDSPSHTNLPPCCLPKPQWKFSWKRLGGALVLIWAAYFILTKTGIANVSPDLDAAAGFGAVFLIGLVAAFSSCTAVLGGLIVATSTAAAERHPNASFGVKFRPHLLFNAGRIVGFVGFGALIGVLGGVFSLSPTVNGLLVGIIALLMVGIGANLLGVIPRGVFSPPKWVTQKIQALSASEHPLVPFVLGALTFFLPCGFTQSMQLYALSTGNPVQAAVIMGIFALGTLPALVGIGAAASATRGKALHRVSKFAGAVVVALGLINVGNSAALLGFSVPSSQAAPSGIAEIKDGEQIVQMEVTNYGVYQPSVLRVKAGTPVRWQIYGGTSMGCASSLVMRAFNINQRLAVGLNEITFTPTVPGRYPFSCSMGMVRGTMVVE